ncbi:hypothetical protein HG263_16930 [Pseudoalteromonas sp. JBTF-M23]|uniref:Solute-binding protein family 3/N-terminal domain-containing protein n=1 Tax=Pseudoalteromonas caenipelagi TaxID=2726988 RepID=A0A849VG13_9GAMM|nr:hypothetical protein [Pseudoalteromonas caenipelagi]NOU52216.1 hypothetical protein [Pseudoalteromonas caenipelagi]
MIYKLCFALLLISQSSFSQTIKYVDATSLRNNPNNMYFVKVLELALSKVSNDKQDIWLQPIDVVITQNRQFIELKKQNIDVMWTMSAQARSEQALAIPVPLAFGSYGIRLLVINKSESHFFNALKDVSQLKRLKALVGRDWPDADILRANGFLIENTYSDEELYRVLQQHSGYYFPRAITEANTELLAIKGEKLMVWSKFVLQYPATMYFYVRKGNQELAQLLERGLKIALDDGSLERLFFSFPHHRNAFSAFDLSDAQFVQLQNKQAELGGVAQQVYKLQKRVIKRALKRAQ